MRGCGLRAAPRSSAEPSGSCVLAYRTRVAVHLRAVGMEIVSCKLRWDLHLTL